MTFLFAMMILAVVLGGILLWLSGLTVGLRAGSDSPGDEEMKSLKDENEALKAGGNSNESKPSIPSPTPLPPQPPPIPVKAPDDEKSKSVQAQLDLEKAAHKKTLDDLTAIKNLFSIKMSQSSTPSGGSEPQRDRNSAGFKTMSIDSRSQSVSGTDHDRLRQSFDQAIREKDRLETELARTQQELQLLKMRQK